jgi:hypothetical protein
VKPTAPRSGEILGDMSHLGASEPSIESPLARGSDILRAKQIEGFAEPRRQVIDRGHAELANLFGPLVSSPLSEHVNLVLPQHRDSADYYLCRLLPLPVVFVSRPRTSVAQRQRPTLDPRSIGGRR